MLKYLTVGYVLKPQGLKGEIKVKPLTDDISRFDNLDSIMIEKNNEYKEFSIIKRRYVKDFVYLMLENYSCVEDAETLRNKYLWIPREKARPLPEDAFFIADLIDCIVECEKGRVIGKISDIIQTGSNDVYVVKGNKGEILIPALKSIVSRVDIDEKKIMVDSTKLEGLIPDEY